MKRARVSRKKAATTNHDRDDAPEAKVLPPVPMFAGGRGGPRSVATPSADSATDTFHEAVAAANSAAPLITTFGSPEDPLIYDQRVGHGSAHGAGIWNDVLMQVRLPLSRSARILASASCLPLHAHPPLLLPFRRRQNSACYQCGDHPRCARAGCKPCRRGRTSAASSRPPGLSRVPRPRRGG